METHGALYREMRSQLFAETSGNIAQVLFELGSRPWHNGVCSVMLVLAFDAKHAKHAGSFQKAEDEEEEEKDPCEKKRRAF